MMKTPVAYRPPQPKELAQCALVWYSAVDDYMARLGHPLPPPYLDPLLDLLRHLLSTDPERFVVGMRPGRGVAAGSHELDMVGFGIAVQREHVWFLSQLYVVPDEQHQGIGRALMTQIMPSLPVGAEGGASGGAGQGSGGGAGGGGAGAASVAGTDAGTTAGVGSGRLLFGDRPASGVPFVPGVLATCTDSAQPVSNGLYSRFGIVPRLPVFNLVGNARPGILAPLPAGVFATSFAELEHGSRPDAPPGTGPAAARLEQTIAAIDRDVLGYAHPQDHAYLRAGSRSGFLYRTAEGRPLGYGYHSEAGRFGPVALLDETLTAPVIGHLLEAVKSRGATTVWIPGANDRAMVALLRAGLRIEGFPAQLCWTRPFAAFDRYIPASLALL
jgi:GNAT superfamily N-acetyltransferase